MVDCPMWGGIGPSPGRRATQDELTLENVLMMRNVFRGILGLILAAAATWLANYVTERIFGPEDQLEEL